MMKEVYDRDARDGWDLTRSIAEASRLPHRRPIIAAIIASDNHCCQRAPRWLLSPSTMTTPSRLLSTPPCCKTAFEETACNRGESLSLFPPRQTRQTLDANHFWTGRERCSFFFLSFFFLSFLHRWFYRRIVESEPSTLLIGHQSPCPFAYMESNSYFVDTSCERYSVYLLLFRKMCIYFAAIEICQSIRICNSFTFSSKDVSIFHFQLKVCNNIPNWARIFDTYMEII